MSDVTTRETGWIAWFARNRVAANLLMALILLAGIGSAATLKIEGFPQLPAKNVTVEVAFDSGSARIADESIAVKIEEALRGVIGIGRISSTSTGSNVTVTVERASGYDLKTLSDDIKNRVDSVEFPTEAEKPVVTRQAWIEPIAYVQVSGDVGIETLHDVAGRLRRRLLADPEIPQVRMASGRTPEISITVDEAVARRYGLTFTEITNRIAAFSTSASQGALRSANGRIAVKAGQQGYWASDFAVIPLITTTSGAVIRLGDVATVADGFEEFQILTRYNGMPSVRLDLEMLGGADLIRAARRAGAIIAEVQAEGWLPADVEVVLWNDASMFIADRLQLMLKNMLMGFALVVVTLALFLNLRVAFWVACGLPVAFAGALFLMGSGPVPLTINELTTFGFIIALGVVVDDAVVVGESVFHAREQEGGGVESTIRGVKRVATPTIFGVLTTIAAFYPITLMSGELAQIFALFAWIVVYTLGFSIIESKFILPAHLAHGRISSAEAPAGINRLWRGPQHAVAAFLTAFRTRIYRPVLRWLLVFRYATLMGSAAILIFAAGLVVSGKVRAVFFPDIAGNLITATYRADPEIGYGPLFREALALEQAARLTDQNLRGKNGGGPVITNVSTIGDENGTVTILVGLTPLSERNVSASDVADHWRSLLGPLPIGRTLEIEASIAGEGDFQIDLFAEDRHTLEIMAREVQDWISVYPGVQETRNTLDAKRARLRLELTDLGHAIGMDVSSLAWQVNARLDGAEVQRLQRGTDEVKIRVRYPADQRSHRMDLNAMQVRTPDGSPIPLTMVATLIDDPEEHEVARVNGQRVATVTANLDKAVVQGSKISEAIVNNFLPELLARYPGMSYQFDGEVGEMAQAQTDFRRVLVIALTSIYALLAVALGSYYLPFIIMAAIPFGAIGALLGHWIVGIPLSILSITGILALCGVVVNDSLLLVSTYKRLLDKGSSVDEALIEAGASRMRAILLTSITTFVGLAPLISETSEQAQFLIPAAVSLGYGILFATLITLVFVPVLVRITEDLRTIAGRLSPREKVDGKLIAASR